MAKKEKKEEDSDHTYDFKETKVEKTIEEQIDEKMQEWEQQKAPDDLHILDIAKDPPEPGYMDVQLKKAVLKTTDEDEKPLEVDTLVLPLQSEKDASKTPPKDDPTIYMNCDGERLQAFDTIMSIDLSQMAEAQVSDCAANIVPMLIDNTVSLAVEEKKARTLEKRKEEFKWWWVLLLMMIIIPIILITMTVLPGLMGG